MYNCEPAAIVARVPTAHAGSIVSAPRMYLLPIIDAANGPALSTCPMCVARLKPPATLYMMLLTSSRRVLPLIAGVRWVLCAKTLLTIDRFCTCGATRNIHACSPLL